MRSPPAPRPANWPCRRGSTSKRRPNGSAAPRSGPEDLRWRARPFRVGRHVLLGRGSCAIRPRHRGTDEPLRQGRGPKPRRAQALIPAVTHHDRADVSAIEALPRRVEARGAGARAQAHGARLPCRGAGPAHLGPSPKFNASLSPRWRNADPEGLRPYRDRRGHGARAEGAGDPRRGPQGPVVHRSGESAIWPPARRLPARSDPTRWGGASYDPSPILGGSRRHGLHADS